MNYDDLYLLDLIHKLRTDVDYLLSITQKIALVLATGGQVIETNGPPLSPPVVPSMPAMAVDGPNGGFYEWNVVTQTWITLMH